MKNLAVETVKDGPVKERFKYKARNSIRSLTSATRLTIALAALTTKLGGHFLRISLCSSDFSSFVSNLAHCRCPSLSPSLVASARYNDDNSNLLLTTRSYYAPPLRETHYVSLDLGQRID